MEERNDGITVRVTACEVGALEQIAVVAGKGQISDVVRTAMLFRDDVFDMVGVEWLPVLSHPAVFTTTRRPFLHQAANGFRNRHQAADLSLSRALD